MRIHFRCIGILACVHVQRTTDNRTAITQRLYCDEAKKKKRINIWSVNKKIRINNWTPYICTPNEQKTVWLTLVFRDSEFSLVNRKSCRYFPFDFLLFFHLWLHCFRYTLFFRLKIFRNKFRRIQNEKLVELFSCLKHNIAESRWNSI